MRRFNDRARQPIGRRETEHQRDDGAVAVSPQHRPLESKRVDHGQRLLHRALMEVHRKIADRSGAAVSGSIRNDDAVTRAERRDLAVERIDLVAPAAVEKDNRRTVAEIAIVNPHRRTSRHQRRALKVDGQHDSLMLVSVESFQGMKKALAVSIAAAVAVIAVAAAPLTPEQTLDRRVDRRASSSRPTDRGSCSP